MATFTCKIEWGAGTGGLVGNSDSSKAMSKAAGKSPTKRSSMTRGKSKNPMDALREQVQTQTQKITQLEYENKSLKERLDGLRKARAATTKVVKAATQFSELKKKEIKLPLLVPAPKEDHNKCEAEIRSLKDKIEDMKDIHMMEVENYKNQIMDKIEGSKEMSADINRLQALCRQLQTKSPHRVPVVIPQPQKPGVDAGMLAELQRRLKESMEATAACASVAQAREEQAARAESERLKAEGHAKKAMLELVASKRKLQLSEEKYNEEVTKMRGNLELMKKAWKKREDDWAAYNEEREAAWKKDAAVWMDSAKSKVAEMQMGADLIAKLTENRLGGD